MEKIDIESSKAVVIEKFVDSGEVDPLYLELPYYVAPDGAVAEETSGHPVGHAREAEGGAVALRPVETASA